MSKWEYKIVKPEMTTSFSKGSNIKENAATEKLNKLGKEGWELIAAFPVAGHGVAMAGATQSVIFIFKREKRGKQEKGDSKESLGGDLL